MDLTTVLVALLTLAAGIAVGVLLTRSGSATTLAERDAARDETASLRAERTELTDRLRAAETEAAGLRATLTHHQQTAAESAAEVQRTIDQLKDSFAGLSAEALARNNEQLATLAAQHLKTASTAASGDLAQRQQAIGALVDPLRETLGKVESQLRTVEQERAAAYADLLAQVGTMRQTNESLRTETSQLVAALRAPQVRGRWGEMQLRRVVESAGMVEHCDFDEQVSVRTDDGILRPDLVVHLAGGKQIVVDAKVAFAGYLEALEAKDEATRATRLAAHARHLRTHVDQLGSKAYWQHFSTAPEFVIAFVPADTFLNAALEQDPSILEHAFERNVVIATPATLIAMLKTVAYTWRQDALASNALEVFELGRTLHSRLSVMGDHVAKLGRSLNAAVGAYNSTVGSLESRVLTTARKMADLKLTDEKLDPPPQLETIARELQAPELVAADDRGLVELELFAREDQEGRTRRGSAEERRSG